MKILPMTGNNSIVKKIPFKSTPEERVLALFDNLDTNQKLNNLKKDMLTINKKLDALKSQENLYFRNLIDADVYLSQMLRSKVYCDADQTDRIKSLKEE